MTKDEINKLPGVTVADGKYTVQADGDGRLRCLRYGEEWRDLTGDGMVLALVQEIEALRADKARLEAENRRLSEQVAALPDRIKAAFLTARALTRTKTL